MLLIVHVNESKTMLLRELNPVSITSGQCQNAQTLTGERTEP
jgi:hypothetical protein